jgi:nucleoside 2-deoxyribosyltransferase
MAGPLFSTAECKFNTALAEQLRLHRHEVFLPQEHEQRSDRPDLIFKSDKAGIDWAQLVLANLDGPDPDSGTCWELGYGYGTNKAIIVYRTDFRLFEGKDKVNLMMTESANVALYVPKMGVDELADLIDSHIRNRFEPTRRSLIEQPVMEADQFGGFDRTARPACAVTPRFRHTDK